MQTALSSSSARPTASRATVPSRGAVAPGTRETSASVTEGVVEDAPFRVQLVVAAVPVAHLLMPCDVVDFLSTIFPNDLAILILTVAIKPLPAGALVEAWKELPP